MSLIERFEDIQAWQEARILTQQIYQLSGSGAFAADAWLRDQIRQAAIGAMQNIAEGFDCDSRQEFTRFLGVAGRAVVELQSFLYVALDTGYISQDVFQTQYAQAAKTKGLIDGLKNSLKK